MIPVEWLISSSATSSITLPEWDAGPIAGLLPSQDWFACIPGWREASRQSKVRCLAQGRLETVMTV
jgi:hypothetical protein